MPLERRAYLRTVGAVSTIGIAGAVSAQQGATVEMMTDGSTYYFDPIGLHVQPGTTVSFRNKKGFHSATAYKEGLGPAQVTRIPEGADGWDTGTLTSSGATAEHTFEVEGTYDYFCIPHKTLGMVGRIVVGSPGGPAEGSMPPDGDVPSSETIVNEGSVSYDAFSSGEVGERTDSGSGTTGGVSRPLVGAGVFGGITTAAVLAYLFVNSEGERYQVGSADWKQWRGLR